MNLIARLTLSGVFVALAAILGGVAVDMALTPLNDMSFGIKTFGSAAVAILALCSLGASAMLWDMTRGKGS